jgi:hypothetical protein
MNKLTDKQKRLIVLGIGLLIILLGVVQAIFKSDIFVRYKRIFDEATFILMMIAAVLLFSKSKPKPEPESSKETGEPEQIAENADEQAKESK